MSSNATTPRPRAGMVLAATLGLLAWLPAAPAAVLDQWGTLAITSTAECTFNGLTFDCGPETPGPQDGDFLVDSAASQIVTPGVGNARSSAALDPSLGLSTPVLKAEAFSDGTDGSAAAGAFALEAYTNITALEQPVVIDITLEGEAGVTTADSNAIVVATLLLIKTSVIPTGSDVQDLIDQISALPPGNFLSTGLALIPGFGFQTVTTGLGDQTDVLGFPDPSDAFSLLPGESAYFFASLSAAAFREMSFADAFGTLTASVREADNFVAASTTVANVPAPAPLYLLAIGMLLLAVATACRRRRAG